MCVHMSLEAESLRVFLDCFSLSSDTGSLTEPETLQVARLASRQVSGNACLRLPRAGIIGVNLHMQLLTQILGIRTQFSCLRVGPFPNEPSPQALPLYCTAKETNDKGWN